MRSQAKTFWLRLVHGAPRPLDLSVTKASAEDLQVRLHSLEKVIGKWCF